MVRSFTSPHMHQRAFSITVPEPNLHLLTCDRTVSTPSLYIRKF